jgi:hypothetical protein
MTDNTLDLSGATAPLTINAVTGTENRQPAHDPAQLLGIVITSDRLMHWLTRYA